MPFLKTSQGLLFELPAGLLRGARSEVSGQVCQRPTCPCGMLDLGFRPVSGTREPNRFERRFSIDLGMREIAAGGTADDRLFAEVLMAQLEPEDWGTVEGVFALLKAELYKAADLTAQDYSFPVDGIERKGLLISYSSVLPFHNRMRFEVAGVSYLAVKESRP